MVIALIVFGVGKLPQAFGAIGKGLRAFKRAESGEDEEEEETPETEQKVAEKVTGGKRKKSVAQGKPVSSRLTKQSRRGTCYRLAQF